MQLAGKNGAYVLGKPLGSGGMADVFTAKVVGTKQKVALKRPRAALSPGDTAMFLREAEAASTVNHESVVKVVDWGDTPPFIAFELVKDPTLESVLEQRRMANSPWPADQLVALYRQLVSAMSAINSRVLHRDLKPSNIFLGPTRVRISDFGLAKYVGEATRTRTFKGWGTPPYISPEAWIDESVDWRSDQYSLGIVFFELATFVRPFVGTTVELEQKHLYAQPPRADAIATSLPGRVASVIARMLEKRREDRYNSWDEVTAALDSAEASLASGVRPIATTIGRELVANLNAHRQAQLDEERAASERARTAASREGVVAFWWQRFSDEAKSLLDELNSHVGSAAISYAIKKNVLNASLLNAHLLLSLAPIDAAIADSELAWGLLKVVTPKSICVANLLLLREPAPYGSWVEVTMEVSPIANRNVHEAVLRDEARGGSYEILGQNRAVLALDSAGLLAQRKLKNTMSLVQYRETPLDLHAALSQCLQVFVNGATAARPSDRSPY